MSIRGTQLATLRPLRAAQLRGGLPNISTQNRRHLYTSESRLFGWNSQIQLYPTNDLGSVGIRDFDLDSLGKCVPKNGVSRSKHLLKPQPLPHQHWGLELRTSLTKAGMVRNVERYSPTHHASPSVRLVELNHSHSHDCASRSLNDTRIRPPTRSSKAMGMKPVVSEPVAGNNGWFTVMARDRALGSQVPCLRPDPVGCGLSERTYFVTMTSTGVLTVFGFLTFVVA